MNQPSAAISPKSESQLARALDEYLAALQSGTAPTKTEILARYPELADDLEACLATLEFISRAAATTRVHEQDGEFLGEPLGDFRILREIGRGGMGVVYEAEQISLGRRVALKVLPFAAVLDPRQLQRFKNEAQAAAGLHHTNIVPVYSVGCDRGVHYYAMQYVEGQTLAEVIRQVSGVRDQESGDCPDFREAKTGLSPSEDAGIRDEGPGAKGEGGMLSQHAALGEHGEAPDMPTPAPPVKSCHPTDSSAHPVTPSPPHPVTDTSPLAALSTEGSTRSPEFFRTVARLGIQAAEALEHAHGMGVVHRDIKPLNVMVEFNLPSPARARGSESPLPSPAGGRGAGGEGTVTQAPHLWITDFGLAMTQTDTNLTMTGDILGTLRYMSPEQVQAKHAVLDHRTDVYSLGVTLYELLTLQPAFPGDDRQRLIRQVIEDDPRPPRQLNRAIPRDLETIILKATAKEPESRYASAQQLADDLRRFLDDEPIRGRRPSPMELARRWAQRHRALVWSTVVLAVAGMVVAAATAWNHHQRRMRLEQAVAKHIGAARAFLHSEDYTAAAREVAQAKTRLAVARYPAGSLQAAVMGLSAEVSAHLDAEEQFRNLQELRQLVHADMYDATPHTMAQVQRRCSDALALYEVLETDSLQQQPAFRYLNAPRQMELREAIAELLFIWARLEISKKQQPDELPKAHRRAISTLRRIDEVYRHVPAIYLWIAESYRALEDEPAARQAQQQAEKPATTALGHFVLGEFQSRQGQHDLDEAIASFTEAIRLSPRNGWAYYERAMAYRRQGNLRRAIEDLDDAIRLMPESRKFYNWRATIQLTSGDFELAAKGFDKANRIDPSSGYGHGCLGWIAFLKGDFKQAIAHYGYAIRLSPDGVEWWHIHRARAYCQTGGYRQAISDCNAALSACPRYTLAYGVRSLAHARLGEQKEALADLGRLSEIDYPRGGIERSTHLWELAWFLTTCPDHRMRKADRAVEAARHGLQFMPNDGCLWIALGAAHYRQGKSEAALQALEKCDELPCYLDAAGWLFRAMAHWRLGDAGQARRWYQKAIRRMEADRPYQLPELPGICAEAAELLDITDTLPTRTRE